MQVQKVSMFYLLNPILIAMFWESKTASSSFLAKLGLSNDIQGFYITINMFSPCIISAPQLVHLLHPYTNLLVWLGSKNQCGFVHLHQKEKLDNQHRQFIHENSKRIFVYFWSLHTSLLCPNREYFHTGIWSSFPKESQLQQSRYWSP